MTINNGLTNGSTLLVNSSTTFTPNITLGSGGGGVLAGSNGGSVTFSGLISGTGGLLTGTQNATLVLSNASNSYSGSTTINGGILSVAADHDLGATTNGITFNNSGTLLTTTSFSDARSMLLNNINSGVAVASGTTLTLNGTLSGTPPQL